MSNPSMSTTRDTPSRHRTVFLDFETYYDTEVSLKKIIAPLYVKHPKFHVIMMAVAVNGGEPEWYRMEEIPDALAKLQLDAEGTVVVCHNAQFDGCVLEYHYGVHTWRYACTVAMAQVSGMALVAGGGSLALLSEYLTNTFNTPHSKGHEVSNMVGVRAQDMDEVMWGLYAKYCMDDVRLTRSVYMATAPSISKNEMRLISETITMTTRPVFKFDPTLLAAYSQEVEDKLATTLTNLQRATGRATNEAVAKYINSDSNFATLLRSYGVTPPQKISLAKVKRQSTQSSLDGFDNGDSTLVFAFSKSDQDFLDLAATHPNETVRDICEARLEVKSGLLRTRAKSLLALANADIAPMPLRYASAHTGRYGGGMKINVQNLPRGSLRRSLVSKEGWVVLAADSSQVEARLNAYIADQQDMLDIFRRGEDLYCHMGAALGGMTYEELFHIAKVAPTDHGAFLRKLGKVTELACGYQMGAAKFADNLALQGIELPEGMSAEGVVKLYRATKDKITAAWAFNGKVVLKRLFDGDVFTFGGPDGKLFKANGSDTLFGQPCATVQLPDGYKLKYYKLAREADPATGYTQYTYLGKDNADGGFMRKKIYAGLMQENLTQALAFAVIKWQGLQIIQLSKGLLRLGLNVHDEWVTTCRVEDIDVAVPVLFEAMTKVPPWLEGCPLDCEVDIGYNYQDMTTL